MPRKIEAYIEEILSAIANIEVAFRNILIHGYFGIDDALVWDIVEHKLKTLKDEVKGN